MSKELLLTTLDKLSCNQSASNMQVNGQEVNYDSKGRRYIWELIDDPNIGPEETQQVCIVYLDED